MDGKDFLSFLVEETYSSKRPEGLEGKLMDYQLPYLKGEFLPQSQVLRFHASFGNIDVPINWSFFALEEAMNDYVMLDETNDSDHFFEVLKSAWDPNIKQILVTNADGFCFLVGLRVGEEHFLHDLLRAEELLQSS